MPHLVEMQKKHGKDGLAVISLSTDEIADGNGEQVRQSVLRILKKINATFAANVILDEKAEFIQEKLHYIASPCIYVFNRQGLWTQFKSDEAEINHEDVEKLVLQYLKEK